MTLSLNEQRQTADLAFLAAGHELTFGDPNALPRPPEALAHIEASDRAVVRVIGSGLSALVYETDFKGRKLAIKVARPECLVQNVDGQTSFLNELRRHAELTELKRTGVSLPGIVAPVYGSLRHGLIVSPWVDGPSVAAFNSRILRQVYGTACNLARYGFFEWDYCPGNLLDDGERVWLFDFGYMYRFDPLTQLNPAGHGTDCPQFHPAERIETRNIFGWLLQKERMSGRDAAEAHFRSVKSTALEAYEHLHANLASAGAASQVLSHYQAIMNDWKTALRTNIAPLYLREGWRSHRNDLDDDLHGKTCTPTTLHRADWLLETLEAQYTLLKNAGGFQGEEREMSQKDLIERYRARRIEAERFQIA